MESRSKLILGGVIGLGIAFAIGLLIGLSSTGSSSGVRESYRMGKANVIGSGNTNVREVLKQVEEDKLRSYLQVRLRTLKAWKEQ